MSVAIEEKVINILVKLTRFPVIPSIPKREKWYRLPLTGCVCADGRPVHADLRLGTENKLLIMFFGGGVCWNAYMAARPNSTAVNGTDESFYATGDSADVADAAVRFGFGPLSKKKSNPFRNWNMLAIPYTTGDFHCGSGDFPYTTLEGKPAVLHHHGYKIYRASLESAMRIIGSEPEQLLVTGFSAGGFGTALLTDDVMRTFPRCTDVTCYVDSGLMLNPGWHHTAKAVWQTPAVIADRLRTNNITLDSLLALYQNHKDRVKIGFSCSVRDAALAEYVNYVEKDKLYADKASGIAFQKQLKAMCAQLQSNIPGVSLFLFDTPDENEEKRAQGLTKHCVLGAENIVTDGISAAAWLWDLVCGKPSQRGLPLLDQVVDS